MTPDHDILRGSEAWKRLQRGIPREVEPVELRDYLHDWANVLPVIVAHLDRMLDEQEAIGTRIDHRKTEHDALEDRVFDGEDGIVVRMKGEWEKRAGAITKGLIATMSTVIVTLVVILIQQLGKGAA